MRAEATVVGVVVSCCYLAQYLAGAVAYARSNYGVPLPYMCACSPAPLRVRNPHFWP